MSDVAMVLVSMKRRSAKTAVLEMYYCTLS